MALPANLVNLATNSAAASTTGYTAVAGTGGTAAVTNQTTAGHTGNDWNRITWSVASTAVGGGAQYGLVTGFTAGTSYGQGIWVRSSVAQTMALGINWQTGGGAAISTATGTSTSVPANTWTRLTIIGTAPATAAQGNLTALVVSGVVWPINATLDLDDIMVMAGTTVHTDFNGSTPPDANYRYLWSGTANASTSQAEYRGVWVEAVAGSGCPRVQVTASGLGTTAGNVTISRTADGETWTVPGWSNRNVTDTDTETDWAPPLGRQVSYTLYFNGQQINTMTITVASTTGWVQDPYDPTTAMPVNTMFTDRTILTLAKGSLDSRTHITNASKATVMGAKRQYSISGQRMPDGGVVIILNAWQNTVSDAFKALTAAPIILFRGLPSWGSIPGLAYIDGPVQEFAVDRYRKPGNNNALTQWTVTGDIVQPVSRRPITGQVTNAQVQTNLAGVTNNTIAARSGTKRNIDVKASPLSL